MTDRQVRRKLVERHRKVRRKAREERAQARSGVPQGRRPRAVVASVSDDCCTVQGITWERQPTPCRHDCHFSPDSWDPSAGEARPTGPVEPARVVRDQAMIRTACGHCGVVLDSPTLAAAHVVEHPKMKLEEGALAA